MNETSETRLLRPAAAASVLCGVLTVIFWVLHPLAADPGAARDEAFFRAVQSGRYAAVNGMFLVIILAAQLALVGFHLRQARAAGALGRAGFGLAFVGTGLFIGPGVFQALVAPALAAQEATRPLLEPTGSLLGGPLGALFAAGGLTFALGLVLFGAAIVRADVLPRWAGVCLIAGSPVLGLSPLMPLAARLVGCALYGAAHVGLGLALFRAAGAQEREAGEGARARGVARAAVNP